MYAPVYSSLVLTAGGVETSTQQNMVDVAGSLVNNIPSGLSYYSRCWSIIGILTLNGDVAKAAINTGISGPQPPAPSPAPTPAPTEAPTPAPTPEETESPTSPTPPTSPSSPTSSPTLRPTSPDGDDDLEEQLDTLNSLLAIIIPLLNAVLSQLSSLLGIFSR